MDAANTSPVLAVRSFPESETAIEVLDDGGRVPPPRLGAQSQDSGENGN